MIELKSIEKAFLRADGKRIDVLKAVNLSISQGHIHGVIGRSGAGKSTLLRCVNLLERPDSGFIAVAGENLLNLNPQALRESRRKMGMIFQHFNLLLTQRVSANIALPLRLAGASHLEQKKRVA